ncbi:MAG: lysophospholipid acyltransferase family protein [Deinococcota bacterium]
MRRAIRVINAGELLAIFPEGEIRPAGQVGELKRGVQFLAERTGAAICPVVMRTVMRGGQYPDMIIDIGKPLTDSSQEVLQQALNDQLATLDSLVLESNPEAPLAGFSLWFQGQSSFHTRVSWLAKLRKLASQYGSEESSNDSGTTSDSRGQDSAHEFTTSVENVSASNKIEHTSHEAKVSSKNTESTTHQSTRGVVSETTMSSGSSKTVSSRTVSSEAVPVVMSPEQPDTQQPRASQTYDQYDQPAMTSTNDASK